MSKLFKVCRWLLVAYLLYCLAGGILLYLLPRHPEKGSVPPAETFLGREQGPDRAALVEEPRISFARRVEIIRSAKESLDISYHCVKSGETTDCFFGEIVKAADRGVHVRFLLDGAIGGLSGEHRDIDLALLAHPNIEFRTYCPIHLLKPWEWNVRLHDKFILADQRMLMLGGRNIGDEYFDPPGYTGSVTWDRDAMIINTRPGSPDSVTAQVKTYMDQLWSAPETKTFKPLSQKKLAAGEAELEELRATSLRWEERYPDFYLPREPVEDIAVPTAKVSLVHNPLKPFKKEPLLGATLARLLDSCRDVRIQTPYACAGSPAVQALETMAADGQVHVLTNSMASTPNLPAFSNYIGRRKAFLKTGAAFYEYQSTNSIHGKSCTADGHLSVVGSFNLDDRSLYIDTESVLVIDSPQFNQVLNSRLDNLFAQSAQVGEDNRYLPDQPVEILPVSTAKRVLIGVVGVFSRLFQFLV